MAATAEAAAAAAAAAAATAAAEELEEEAAATAASSPSPCLATFLAGKNALSEVAEVEGGTEEEEEEVAGAAAGEGDDAEVGLLSFLFFRKRIRGTKRRG